MITSLIIRVQNALGYRVRDRFQRFLWHNIKLQWKLRSGVSIQISNQAEWVIYNDIFVDREYDLPIKQALETALGDRMLHVLDLGANVGYFTLRVVDLIRQSSNPQINFHITLVEGSPRTYEQLTLRLNSQAQLANCITTIHGLVGQLQGSDRIYESDFHVMSSISKEQATGGIDVVYIDLNEAMEKVQEIDLLKCDIEGSERSFLENYGELLKKVRVAVFEIHHNSCNISWCHTILRQAGFENHKALHDDTAFSLHFFWK